MRKCLGQKWPKQWGGGGGGRGAGINSLENYFSLNFSLQVICLVHQTKKSFDFYLTRAFYAICRVIKKKENNH